MFKLLIPISYCQTRWYEYFSKSLLEKMSINLWSIFYISFMFMIDLYILFSILNF